MPVPGRTQIGLPTDGAGKRMDSWSYQVWDTDTQSYVTVYAQAAVLVDPNGNPLFTANGGLPLVTQDDPVRRLLESLLVQQRICNELLARLTGGQLDQPENQRGF